MCNCCKVSKSPDCRKISKCEKPKCEKVKLVCKKKESRCKSPLLESRDLSYYLEERDFICKYGCPKVRECECELKCKVKSRCELPCEQPCELPCEQRCELPCEEREPLKVCYPANYQIISPSPCEPCVQPCVQPLPPCPQPFPQPFPYYGQQLPYPYPQPFPYYGQQSCCNTGQYPLPSQ